MNLQVPSNLLGNKLMGIAVCAVVVFRKRHSLHQHHIQDHGFMIGAQRLGCYISRSKDFKCIGFSEDFGNTKSYHLLVRYYPSYFFGFGEDWEEILNQVDANGFRQIKVKFRPEFRSRFGPKFRPEGPRLEVMKCGAHLVSERDIEDLINQTKAGPSGCIITPYDEDGFEDLEKDTKIKQSSDDSDGEGAIPSGEATSNDEPPHLNLIENWFGNFDCEEEESQ